MEVNSALMVHDLKDAETELVVLVFNGIDLLS